MATDRIIRNSCAILYIDNGFNLDFARHIFRPDKETGHLRVRSTTIPGKLITYLAKPSAVQPELQEFNGRTACILDIPQVDGVPVNRWMMFDAEDTDRINQVLSAAFELDFYRYYLRGLHYDYKKKDIIENYVISRDLTTGQPFDTLHKRVFRKEMTTFQKKVSALQRKAKYFFEETDES